MNWIIKDYRFISYFLNSNIGYWLQILRLILGFSGILPHNGGVVLNIDGSSLPVILDSQILVKLFEMKILILILSKRNPWHGLNQLWFRGIRQNNCYSDSLEVISLLFSLFQTFSYACFSCQDSQPTQLSVECIPQAYPSWRKSVCRLERQSLKLVFKLASYFMKSARLLSFPPTQPASKLNNKQ